MVEAKGDRRSPISENFLGTPESGDDNCKGHAEKATKATTNKKAAHTWGFPKQGGRPKSSFQWDFP